MDNLKEKVDAVLFYFVSWLFIISVGLATVNVVLRYVFNVPIQFADEFLRFGLAWVCLIGTAWVVGQKGHLAMTAFHNLIKDRRNYLTLQVVIDFISIVFFVVVLICGGTSLAHKMSFQKSSSMGLSMGLVYASLPICGILSTFYLIVDIVNIYLEFGKLSKEGSN